MEANFTFQLNSV